MKDNGLRKGDHMDMGQENKREKWYRLMQEFNGSGKSMNEWCAEVGCTQHMFKYWRYKVRIHETYQDCDVAPDTQWIEMPQPSIGGVSIRVSGTLVEIEPGFDKQLLRDVVEALS
jgi:hypothetical protein